MGRALPLLCCFSVSLWASFLCKCRFLFYSEKCRSLKENKCLLYIHLYPRGSATLSPNMESFSSLVVDRKWRILVKQCLLSLVRWSLNFLVPKCVSIRAPDKTIEVYKIFILLPSWYCVLILICFFLNYFIHECEEVKGNSYESILVDT